MSPLFVSYHTPDALYADHARGLMESLRQHQLDHHLDQVEPLGSWLKNTARKAGWLLEVRRKNPGRPLVWLDADSRVKAPPVLFDEMAARCVDLAFHTFRGQQACSGTVFCGAGPLGTRALELWAELCESRPRLFDQVNLAAAAKEMSSVPGFLFEELPPAYCFIFDLSRKAYPGVEPVIEHWQASRQVTNKGC